MWLFVLFLGGLELTREAIFQGGFVAPSTSRVKMFDSQSLDEESDGCSQK